MLAIQTAIDWARFDEAAARVRALENRSGLPARAMNALLELKAIVQIAGRDESAAEATLASLYARDPDHTRLVHDAGPAVESAFARARPSRPAPVEVGVWAGLDLDAVGRLVARVRFDKHPGAIDAVHIFTRARGENEFTHVEASVHDDEMLVAVPALLPGTERVEYYVEARAPSGYRLASLGSLITPLEARVPHRPPAAAPCATEVKPLRREWWLWTTLGLVASSVVIAGAVAAR